MTIEEIDKRIEELDNRIQEIMQGIKALTDTLVDARVEKERWEEIRITNIGALLDDVIHHAKENRKESENDK